MTFTSEDYRTREPEMLLLEGYRNWTMGVAECQISYWDQARNLFSESMGSGKGGIALDALMHFLQTLGMCAACPMKTHRPKSPHLCFDEILVLGLVAGIQHENERVIAFCLDTLCCPAHIKNVEYAARAFAITFGSMNRKLLPVPLAVLQDIASKTNRHRIKTLH